MIKKVYMVNSRLFSFEYNSENKAIAVADFNYQTAQWRKILFTLKWTTKELTLFEGMGTVFASEKVEIEINEATNTNPHFTLIYVNGVQRHVIPLQKKQEINKSKEELESDFTMDLFFKKYQQRFEKEQGIWRFFTQPKINTNWSIDKLLHYAQSDSCCRLVWEELGIMTVKGELTDKGKALESTLPKNAMG